MPVKAQILHFSRCEIFFLRHFHVLPTSYGSSCVQSLNRTYDTYIGLLAPIIRAKTTV